MVILVSMGGLIFGFDTGQISGFLAMDNFRQRFGEYDPVGNVYYFSNVRAGLLVGMVMRLPFAFLRLVVDRM